MDGASYMCTQKADLKTDFVRLQIQPHALSSKASYNSWYGPDSCSTCVVVLSGAQLHGQRQDFQAASGFTALSTVQHDITYAKQVGQVKMCQG